ncbi:MAG: pirin family protein [Phycisphaerales bacterium]
MIQVRKSADRGHFDHGWLDTYHTFSFARYYDPAHMGFRSLRVINQDVVAPGRGFGEHPHDNMEIITYILSGQLAHKDSAGHTATIGPGEVQKMTAGRGIAHSEFNPSHKDPVHLLQIWIEPAREGLDPSFEQKRLDPAMLRNRLEPIVQPEGGESAVSIAQDARVYAGVIEPGRSVEHALAPGRHAWVQIIRGEADLNGQRLGPGDGAAVSGEPSLTLSPSSETEVLLFDLA